MIAFCYLFGMRRSDQPSPLVVAVGHALKQGRMAAGWTQRGLAARLGVDPSTICRIEHARLRGVGLDLAGRALEEVGARHTLAVEGPFVEDRRRQRDPVHARCVAYIRRRLERAGWVAEQEVEIGRGRYRGWIDLLACDVVEAALLTIEFKSALPDVGAAERQVDWYQRHAYEAARRFGWRPRSPRALLLLLATEANDARVRENAAPLRYSLPGRAVGFEPWLADRTTPAPPRRGLAMVDPYDRHARWLRPTRADGRRTQAPYLDYVDFIRRARAGRGGYASASTAATSSRAPRRPSTS